MKKRYQVRFCKFPLWSFEDLCRRLCARSPWQVLHRSFCARSLCKAIFTRCLKEISTDLKVRSLSKLSIGDLWARSLFSSPGLRTRPLQEICWQDLCTSSLHSISWQDLCKRALGKISVQDLYERSLYGISLSGLLARSLRKLSIQDLLVKISAQDLLDYQNEQCATKREVCSKCREGCASDIKIRTAPQREQPDPHKVTNGLHEHTLDLHKKKPAPWKMNSENAWKCQKRCFT